MKDTLAALYLKLRRTVVHRAKTREERQAIYRFRYAIYVEELGREIGGVDHHRRMVCDEEDEAPWSHHLYVGEPSEPHAAVRLRVWGPGEIPAAVRRDLSIERFGPTIESMTVAELGRFMIAKGHRGAPMLLGSIAYETYLFLGGEMKVDLSFSYCRPGLVPYYRRLGGRPYGGALVHAPEGMEVPLVSVMSDRAYFKKAGSPMTPLVSQVFGKGRRPEVDDSRFRHLFDNDHCGVITDREAVWSHFAESLTLDASGTFLSDLDPATLGHLSDGGFIMELQAGQLVTREGHAEQEMFVVLAGELEVVRGTKTIAKLGRGDVFGEMAFFLARGERTASVRTLRPSRLVLLKRSFIDVLRKKHPEAANTLLFSLGRVLAARLAQQ